MPNLAARTPFSALLARGAGGQEAARTAQLADLLDKMMALDPEKRLDPEQALRHPFVRDYLPRSKPKARG
jgi:serine/threonine-protein kinase PRP4